MPPKTPAGWFPHRGDLCWVALDKDRPALVLSADALNRYALDVCIVPLTTVSRPAFSLRVLLKAGEGGLRRNSWAKCDQVTTVEKALVKYPPLGHLPAARLGQIEEAVKLALQLL
jgi:mRNA interferase MazF